MLRLRKFCRNEEGSALVELYFAGFLMATMILGAAELGRIAWASIEVTNAAHAGIEYATSSHKAASDFVNTNGTYTGGIVTAALADADTFGGNSSIAVTSISAACTCANSSYTPTSCSDNTTCQSHNTSMIENITVQTTGTYYPIIRWPGGPTQVTLYGQATQKVSNQ